MDQNDAFSWALELQISEWINSDSFISSDGLRGRVVVMEAFQMLCPCCAAHGLPQVQRIFEMLSPEGVAVLGLHTVFEHQATMTPVSLKAFAFEYKLRVPIGIDEPGLGHLPKTRQSYGLFGTSSLVATDAMWRLRGNYFRSASDLQIGYQIANFLSDRHGRIVDLETDKNMNVSTEFDEQGSPVV
tara:strand:+ start:1991 stop:2548 length:558 start_codon:yes stop_codon:yes gene_type:complete